MQPPSLEELGVLKPAIFLIGHPLLADRNLYDADRINAITGMTNESIATILLDMLCCHLLVGDPNRTDFEIDQQYMEWLMEDLYVPTDDELADLATHFVNIHMTMYRPLLLNNETKIHRFNTEDYNYEWKYLNDDREIALVFKTE